MLSGEGAPMLSDEGAPMLFDEGAPVLSDFGRSDKDFYYCSFWRVSLCQCGVEIALWDFFVARI